MLGPLLIATGRAAVCVWKDLLEEMVPSLALALMRVGCGWGLRSDGVQCPVR